jgi:predicted RNA binding protein YcfA (HicA-like mRNA interferase family)
VASELRVGQVTRLLKAKGYFLHRIRGSHHTFKKASGDSFTFPVHAGKVKPVYVRQIEKLP